MPVTAVRGLERLSDLGLELGVRVRAGEAGLVVEERRARDAGDFQ